MYCRGGVLAAGGVQLSACDVQSTNSFEISFLQPSTNYCANCGKTKKIQWMVGGAGPVLCRTQGVPG